MTEDISQMTRRCRTCRGEGVVEDYHCRLCQEHITDVDTWWYSDEATMPCGHAEEYLVETITCPDCGGTGLVEQWLTPAEVAAIKRGKAVRVLFVAGALITLFIVLASVVLGSADTEPICGYWWYAVPALLLAASRWPA